MLVQLSDPHIGALWTGGNPAQALAAVVAEVARVAPEPLAVVVSGDLADHARAEEYELLAELLAPLRAPLHVLAGNHDDRDALRGHFGIPGAAGAPVQYSAALGPLRLVALDSSEPGIDGGRLDGERLAWLEAELALEPDALTLVALHHPPPFSGLAAGDAISLPTADADALARVLARHQQVALLIAGHTHRAVAGRLGACGVLCAPSTCVQAALDFACDSLSFPLQQPGFALHVLAGDALASHIVSVRA